MIRYNSQGKLLFVLLLVFLLVSPVTGSIESDQTTVTALFHEIIITTDDLVMDVGGYTVNGVANPGRVIASSGGNYEILIPNLPAGSKMITEVTSDGHYQVSEDHPLRITMGLFDESKVFYVHLSLDGYSPKPVIPLPDSPSVTPVRPVTPVIPDEPDYPENPDTPSDPEHPDTPNSDEPLVPILPPADSVYNFAGFIPLLAGFFLLFLLVAFRGNLVYRILKKHAKRHGEKPDKEEKKQLKATASAIILLIRDEERYGEWRKNREMEMRLSADIISVLDEMQYPPQIPRGAAAAEILKAAKGRINRHRL